MVADLVLIALGIALKTGRLSAFILILSIEGGTKKGLGFILGWLTCLVLVIAVVVLVTGGQPVRLRAVPSAVVVTIAASTQLAASRRRGRSTAESAGLSIKAASLRGVAAAWSYSAYLPANNR